MIHPSDRQTDGRAIAYMHYRMLSRVKTLEQTRLIRFLADIFWLF